MKLATSNEAARFHGVGGAGRIAAMIVALFLTDRSATALSITVRDLADGDLIARTDLAGSVVVSRPGVTTVNGTVITVGGAAIPAAGFAVYGEVASSLTTPPTCVYSPANPHNVVRATFTGLSELKDPVMVARMRAYSAGLKPK